MPMMPSPVAAVTYGAVKVAGYALFARVLNRYAQKPAPPLKFGIVKTAIGLAGGVIYLVLLTYFTRDDVSNVETFVGVLPVRLLVWAIVIDRFYRDGLQRRTKVIAIFAGTAWSYVLDGVMALIYRIIPGMVMPFC
jgi:FtsH-binding integral membrane protein